MNVFAVHVVHLSARGARRGADTLRLMAMLIIVFR